eukprot:CAMPEP_0194490740 /NCGR_PEP_ID=MMETSP0253-20130528/9852_1 /TAXON_ID=2966 /ORGANISM="Noctiluca scintillans" /LENGTH=136 /DNA_ID=CAMNT_0039331401 /DNA_START=1 /DNA_END=411 /DNA_ORIENTATION=-
MKVTTSADANLEGTPSADADMDMSVVALFIALCLCVSSLIGCCVFIVRLSTKEQTQTYHADPSMMYPGAWMRESMPPSASMHSKYPRTHRGAPMHSKSSREHHGAPMQSNSWGMYEDPSMMYQDPSMMYQDPYGRY